MTRKRMFVLLLCIVSLVMALSVSAEDMSQPFFLAAPYGSFSTACPYLENAGSGTIVPGCDEDNGEWMLEFVTGTGFRRKVRDLDYVTNSYRINFDDVNPIGINFSVDVKWEEDNYPDTEPCDANSRMFAIIYPYQYNTVSFNYGHYVDIGGCELAGAGWVRYHWTTNDIHNNPEWKHMGGWRELQVDIVRRISPTNGAAGVLTGIKSINVDNVVLQVWGMGFVYSTPTPSPVATVFEYPTAFPLGTAVPLPTLGATPTPGEIWPTIMPGVDVTIMPTRCIGWEETTVGDSTLPSLQTCFEPQQVAVSSDNVLTNFFDVNGAMLTLFSAAAAFLIFGWVRNR